MKLGLHKVAWILKWETKVNILCNAFYFFKVNFPKIVWLGILYRAFHFHQLMWKRLVCGTCLLKAQRYSSFKPFSSPAHTIKNVLFFICWALTSSECQELAKRDFIQNSWLLSALHHEWIVVLSLFLKVKRSIFASPESVNGKVGVGTCGIADKPMTQYNDTSKYNVRHLMPQWFSVSCK